VIFSSHHKKSSELCSNYDTTGSLVIDHHVRQDLSGTK
jgi:hypothetical protein